MQASIVDQAAEAIRQYIFSRRLTAGHRLPSERDLAEALGTSRPALREAIRRLVGDRVVEVRGRSGIYVAAIDVEEIFEVRLALEPLAARLAAYNRSPDDLYELEAMVAELREELNNPAVFSAIDRRIHVAVASLTGNDVLSRFIVQLGDLTTISRGITAHEDETRQGTATEMSALVAAIRDRDGEAASDAMRSHLERIRAIATDLKSEPLLPASLAAVR